MQEVNATSLGYPLSLNQSHSCAAEMIDRLGIAAEHVVLSELDRISRQNSGIERSTAETIVKLACKRDLAGLASLIRSLGYTVLNEEWGNPVPPRHLWPLINEYRANSDDPDAIERVTWASRPLRSSFRKPRKSVGPAEEFMDDDDQSIVSGQKRFWYRLSKSDLEVIQKVCPGCDPMDPPFALVVCQLRAAISALHPGKPVSDEQVIDFEVPTIMAVLDQMPVCPIDEMPPICPDFKSELALGRYVEAVAYQFELLDVLSQLDSIYPRHFDGLESRVDEYLRHWGQASSHSIAALRGEAAIEARSSGMESIVDPFIEVLGIEVLTEANAARKVSRNNCSPAAAGVRHIQSLSPHFEKYDTLEWQVRAGLAHNRREVTSRAECQTGADSVSNMPRLSQNILNQSAMTAKENYPIMMSSTNLATEPQQEFELFEIATTILMSEPEISITSLAKRLGVSRSTIDRNRLVMDRVAAIKSVRNSHSIMRRGSKTDGDIEAVDFDETGSEFDDQ